VSTCLCGRGHSGRPEATHDVEPLLDEAPCATADPPVDGRHVTPEAIEVPRHEVRGDGLHSPPLEFVLEVLYAFRAVETVEVRVAGVTLCDEQVVEQGSSLHQEAEASG